MRKEAHIASAIVLMLLFFQCAIAQLAENAYALHDLYGKVVYRVPEVIAKKTMDVTLSSSSPALTPARLGSGTMYVIQVGTFAVRENAYRLKEKLQADGYVVEVRTCCSRQKNPFYVVFAGSFASTHEAFERLQTIKSAYGLDGLLRTRTSGKG